jgi:hypothetical protein
VRTLVILTAYDPALPGTRTLYLTHGTAFITAASETPASQSFAPVLAQPLDVRVRVQGLGGLTPSLGDLRVENRDGAYDAWLGYAFDGRALVVRTGPDQGDYPTDYPVTFTGTIDRVDVLRDSIILRVRDAVAALDTPLQTTLYAGDNVAPDGLEGESDLEAVPKPLTFGRVKNVPARLVNAQKLIYQVSDDIVDSVDGVYDRGIALGPYAPVDFAEAGTNQGGMCVAVSDTTMVFGGWDGTNPEITTTTDGASFSVIGSLPFISTGAVIGMAYSPTLDRFCAVTNNATGEIATSDDDGATWTIQTAAAAVSFNNVRWCTRRSLFIAVGDGGALHTSANGIAWNARTSSTAQDLFDVAVGGPLLVAVGNAGAVPFSSDGTTWTSNSVDASVNRSAALWHNGYYYIGGGTTNTVYRGTNGIAWGQSVVVATATAVEDFAVSPDGGWVVCLLRLANAFFYVAGTRDNGVSWVVTERYAPLSQAQAVAAFKDRFYVTSADIAAANTNVYRSGAPAAYASLADLEDDDLAPLPGSYKYIAHADGTYIRLGATPDEPVTVDATQGAATANRTAGQLIVKVLERAGYTTGDWNATDITNLDTADNSECGLYVDDLMTVAECVDRLARTVGAFWWVDAAGVFRVQQLAAPSGSSTFDVTEYDVRQPLDRISSADPLLGIPSYRTTLRYARSDTLALDGTVVDTDAAVQTRHLLARATDEETLYTTLADAQAEATRRQTLRGVTRQAYQALVSLEDFADVEIGDVGTLTHPRFGLSGGELVRVLGREPNAANRSLLLTLWF